MAPFDQDRGSLLKGNVTRDQDFLPEVPAASEESTDTVTAAPDWHDTPLLAAGRPV